MSRIERTQGSASDFAIMWTAEYSEIQSSNGKDNDFYG